MSTSTWPPAICQHSYKLSLCSRRFSTWIALFLSCNELFLCTGWPKLCVFCAELGWRRSGDNARRSSGEPGSQLLGRPRLFLLAGVSVWLGLGLDCCCPGLYFWVIFDIPGGWRIAAWPCTIVSGLGLRVGDVAIGDGEGVRASGDNGMLWTDLRRCGDFVLGCWIFLCCLSPERDVGRV